MYRCGKPAISRVLYFRWYSGNDPPTMEATIIYLGRALLRGSSDQPERAPGKGCGLKGRRVLSVLLRMGFTSRVVTNAARGLLHHGSTLA